MELYNPSVLPLYQGRATMFIGHEMHSSGGNNCTVRSTISKYWITCQIAFIPFASVQKPTQI